MKTKTIIISLLLILFTGALITPHKAGAQAVTVGFQVFYDELSPYGTWINNTRIDRSRNVTNNASQAAAPTTSTVPTI